jgi:dTDP-glucose pyrophosphorylase
VTDRLQRCLVPASGRLRDALQAVDLGAAGIALAVDDDGRLVGVATDGDIRRALLAGTTLDDPLGPVLNREFASVGRGRTRADALDLMISRHIDAIPALDEDGRPNALHLLHGFIEPAPRDNWAVVMAGGRGRRLEPLTDTVPKPMLSVAGRPILERIVLHLVGNGIGRIFISVHYLAHVIEEHFGDGSAFGARIEYLREDAPLGTGGALGLLPEPPQRTLVVLNGDLVTGVDVVRLIEAHDRGGFAATIGTRRYVHTIPFGTVEREGDVVTALEEKPSVVREVNTGIYALAPETVALVERGTPITMPALVDRVLSLGRPVGAFEIEDDWIDVGQRDQLARAREGG